jgi:hypothetical protein
MTDAVARLARAVLYEGYVLWPYRRSALKNRQRWTLGVITPPAFEAGTSAMQAECLLEAEAEAEAAVDVTLRFLHVVARQAITAAGMPVDELEAGGARYLSWDEATEREVTVVDVGLGVERGVPIAVPAGSTQEPVAAGTIVRTWEDLRGTLTVATEPLGGALHRVRASVANTGTGTAASRDAAVRRAFCSAHVVLRVRGGAFVSLTDPPPALRAAAKACRNVGTWPVLVGAPGERHTVLAAPVILPDHPEVAPESFGDLFDATEIDQLLVLNVLGLTDAEQAEMQATDPRTREILARCRGLSAEALLRLHGVLRGVRPPSGS